MKQSVSKLKNILYQGKFLRLVQSNGWEYVERGSALKTDVIAVLPIYRVEGYISTRLVSQYRPALDKHVISLVAGLVDVNETHEKAARRELLEEAGLVSDDLVYVGEFPSSSGLTNETVHVFLAFNCQPTLDSNWKPDEEEGITVHPVPLSGLHNFLTVKRAEGMLIDAKIYPAVRFYEDVWSPVVRRDPK
jgi:ADP-ribose pyrophosphatase